MQTNDMKGEGNPIGEVSEQPRIFLWRLPLAENTTTIAIECPKGRLEDEDFVALLEVIEMSRQTFAKSAERRKDGAK